MERDARHTADRHTPARARTGAVDITEPPHAPEATTVLTRVALALTSSLELRDVLRQLAEIALDVTDAHRASVFVREGDRLDPAVSLGTRPDEHAWSRFRAMGSIQLDPVQWESLFAGRAVSIPDATTSALIPGAWTEMFSLQGLGMVPLIADGTPCGLLAVDWPHPHVLGEEELSLLDALGSYAGIAVHNARLYTTARQRARLAGSLSESAAAMSGVIDRAGLTRCLRESIDSLLEPVASVVALLDSTLHHVTHVSSRGMPELRAPLPLTGLPRAAVSQLWREWAEDKRPLRFDAGWEMAEVIGGAPPGVTDYLALPIDVTGSCRAVTLLGFGPGRFPDEAAMDAARTLTEIGASTLQRQALVSDLDRHARRLDALYRLSVEVDRGVEGPALFDTLRDLLAGVGIEAVGLELKDRRLVAGLATDLAIESGDLSSRQAGGDDAPFDVPIWAGRRRVGSILIRAGQLEEEDRAFLDALGRGLADVLHRRASRSAFERAARERAVATERERIAANLHDTVGEQLLAIGLLARRQVEEDPAGSAWSGRTARLAELADKAKWEIDDTVQALELSPASRRGLVHSLRALAQSVHADCGSAVDVDVTGRPARLAPKTEQALFQVAHRAISDAWRLGRADYIRVALSFAQERVSLDVADDGAGLSVRYRTAGPHTAAGPLKRIIADAGGSLRIRNGHPRGVSIEVTVPRRSQ